MRLPDYDYAQNGAYFVTVCTDGRKNLFWNVGATCGRPQDDSPLSLIGKMVDTEIKRIGDIYDNVSIDKYTVMPNHIHMIIIIDSGPIGRPEPGAPKKHSFLGWENAPTVSRIIQQFKGVISKKAGFPLWQRSFHDHIIRTGQEYAEVWNCIDINLLKWDTDRYYTR